jgi:hypothetical protein
MQGNQQRTQVLTCQKVSTQAPILVSTLTVTVGMPPLNSVILWTEFPTDRPEVRCALRGFVLEVQGVWGRTPVSSRFVDLPMSLT